MHRTIFLSILFLLPGAGCHRVQVEVESRLVSDVSLWGRLDGPGYVISGPDEQAEASLAFQEFADMLAAALKLRRPELQRAAPGEPAELSLTLTCRVVDRGTAVETYPVYGPRAGFLYGYGYGYPDYGLVGTEVRTVDLGYQHAACLSAWIADGSGPAGRRVVWEGCGSLNSSQRSLKQTMPFLLVALVSVYGEATDVPLVVKLDHDDPRVERVGEVAQVRSRFIGTQPAAVSQDAGALSRIRHRR